MGQASVAARKGREEYSCTILHSDAEPYRISAEIDGIFKFSGPCADVFDGLCDVRNRLEPLGIRLLCAGARRDVYPSRMARQMGGGVLAYQMTMSVPAKNSDMVRIFDTASADQIGTVEEQSDYFTRWLASLR